jgi:anti-anti-sigma factor
MSPVEGGSSGFSVARRDQDGVLILVIRGEVDADTSLALAQDFEAAAAGTGPVVIDLCGASFMDSAGLYAMMVLRRRLIEHDRRVAVAYWPQGAIATIFHVSGTDELFEVHPSRAAAVAALRG